MKFTVGQLLMLVRGAIQAESGSLAKNQSLRNLTQLEGNAAAWLGKVALETSVEPSQDFGEGSPQQSEPEDEPKSAKAAPTRSRGKKSEPPPEEDNQEEDEFDKEFDDLLDKDMEV